jgi:glycosyltransferase involved in cell wall biosynthesis
MTLAPIVSVVMSVYNGADFLDRTLDSILGQTGVDLEFVVVNDGSTDGTAEVLDHRSAKDPRLVVLHQVNTGLTIALQRGCEKARGRYIARQDAGGDISLPGRLQRQLELLDSRPEAVMVSCGTRFVGPEAQLLFDVVQNDSELKKGLGTLSIPGIRGPSHHGSTMFTRQAYEQVGGYRPGYVVAQDMDLWLRLFELGACLAMPEVLYQARVASGTISSRLQGRQVAYGMAAIEAARSRRQGQGEPPFPLSRNSWAHVGLRADPHEVSAMHYFLGSCLMHHDRSEARKHFWLALKHRPLHLKAWMRAVRSYLLR